jgi:hypothetical protein
MKGLARRLPTLGDMARRVYRTLTLAARRRTPFAGSEQYWEARYAAGGDSGVGSYGKFARFKADVVNAFVAERGVRSVIEFGCGDGNQLALASYPQYLGLDASETAVSACRRRFASDQTKSFALMRHYRGERADLALSLDVIYHLVEDQVFERYVRTLFAASDRFVIIYSSDTDDTRRDEGPHVRHRKFSRWVRENLPEWRLVERIPNKYPFRGDYREGSFAEFFIFEKG